MTGSDVLLQDDVVLGRQPEGNAQSCSMSRQVLTLNPQMNFVDTLVFS